MRTSAAARPCKCRCVLTNNGAAVHLCGACAMHGCWGTAFAPGPPAERLECRVGVREHRGLVLFRPRVGRPRCIDSSSSLLSRPGPGASPPAGARRRCSRRRRAFHRAALGRCSVRTFRVVYTCTGRPQARDLSSLRRSGRCGRPPVAGGDVRCRRYMHGCISACSRRPARARSHPPRCGRAGRFKFGVSVDSFLPNEVRWRRVAAQRRSC